MKQRRKNGVNNINMKENEESERNVNQ